MHWIAREILKKLAFTDGARYGELKPDGVEGNLFQYHARGLEREGLIARGSEGYSLTEAGRRHVGDLSLAGGMKRRVLPGVMMVVVARDMSGQWLLFRWRRWPWRGLVGLVGGRHTAGRPAVEVAAEQLRNKTGYEAEPRFVGLMSVIGTDSHILMEVFEAVNLRGEHGSDGLTGISFWGNPAEFGDTVPGFAKMIRWLEMDDGERPAMLEIIIEK